MLQTVPAVTSAIKIKASSSHCFFENWNGPAKASGKNKSGNLIRMISSHSFLSSLHKPESNGRKKSKLILHKMGDEKKLRIWLLISRWKKQNRTNTIMVNDSNALEKKSDTIIMIIRIKMTVCVHLIIIESFCNL